MRKFKRKIGESYRPKFTKICYTGKGIQLEDGEGRVLRGKVFDSEEDARAYATRMYGFCRNESSEVGLNKADPYIVLANKSVRMNEARKPMKKKVKSNYKNL